MGNRNHGNLLKKATTAGLICLLLIAGVPTAVANCEDWKKKKFFKSAAADEVRACLSAGEDPNKPDTKGLTALHRAARDTADPAVIGALLDAGADPRASSIAGRTPWHYARANGKIKGSDAYQRLMMAVDSLKKVSARRADWSKVQAVLHDTRVTVWMYQDAASRENRKMRGRFHSATADSITLMLENGQTRTVQKTAVRKVLVPRPFAKRWPGWATLAGSVLAAELFRLWVQDLPAHLAAINLSIAAGATIFAFFNSGMGPIYNVPPKHRILPVGDKQPSAQDNASGSQEYQRRD